MAFIAADPGAYSFTYSVNDTDEASSNTATVSVEVNRPLQAFEDTARVILGTQTDVDVLSNDEGVTSGMLVSIMSGPNSGSATVTNDRKIQYTDGGLLGEGELTYKVSDSEQTSNATLTIVVAKQARGPVALDDSETVETDKTLTISVLDNDLAEIDSAIDADSLQITAQPDSPAEADVNADGTISFMSAQVGTYTLKYMVNGLNEEGSNEATVTVIVSQ